jgi:tRNA (guanine-N7-)-methyltransferase
MPLSDTPRAETRPVRTFVRRSGHGTPGQRRAYQELWEQWCVPYTGRPLDSAGLFGNGNPLVAEIGFGMGAATWQIARANPGVNYLGIEVYRNGVGKLLGEIHSRGLQNLRIIEHDALEVLEAMIPDNTLQGIHLFFPDPWPKKRHHKRRLVQRPRTDLLAAKLAPGGCLCFVTDWEPYALSAKDALDATPGLCNPYGGFAPSQAWRPKTKFEIKGTANNRAIRELVYRKIPAGLGRD